MPSYEVADDLWHGFILGTRNCQVFCRQAFGGLVHHTPAAVMGGERRSGAGPRRCGGGGCGRRTANPRPPG